MKNMLALNQSVDKLVAILGYDNDLKVNSICCPSHVLDKHVEFSQYFPRYHITTNKIAVKYRMTSSVSLEAIKAKLRPKLDDYSYFI